MISPGMQRALYIVMMIAAIVAAVATFMMPPVVMLGKLVRLVVFHGAYTWVNMGAFTVAGLVALAFLATRSERLYAWASGFRRLAVAGWVVNTVLGMLSAKLSWGTVNLEEPRLQATFIILFLSGIVLAVDFFVSSDRVTALADAGMAVALWWLILGARNFVHPDSPVMNSGWEIKGPFFAIVAAVGVFALAAAALLTHGASAERSDTVRLAAERDAA